MPIGGFTVGRDISLTMFYNGGIQSLGLITDFNSKPMTSEVKILGIDGVMRTLIFPEGWTGEFMITRQDSTLDDLWDNIEADYYGGANIPFGVINDTIENPDGSISAHRYINVALKLEDAGGYSGNKEVKQKLSFAASFRKSA